MNVFASNEARVLHEYNELEKYVESVNGVFGPVVGDVFYKGKAFLEFACENNMKIKSKELEELEKFCNTIGNNIKLQIKIAEKELNIKISNYE